MKIYLLYENPYDEGDNIFGAFSSEEKVNEAYEIFSEVNNHELYIREFELDDLENYYQEAKSGYQFYYGSRSRSDLGRGVLYGVWKFNQTGLETILDKDKHVYVIEFKTHTDAFVKAKSEKEAEEIANKILEEKQEGYSAWLE